MNLKQSVLCALLAAFCASTVAFAAPEDVDQPAKKRPGAEARQRNSEAKPGPRLQRPDGQTPDGQARQAMQRGMREPGQMVAMMMQKFDSDGDAKLNTEELTAMLTFMRERQGQMGRPGADGNRPRPGSDKRIGSGPEKNAEVGGVKPRRPAAE